VREVDHAPYAPALIESMRAVGYSLESAVADIIDNSVSAKARHIRLRFSPYREPYVAIIDDGCGMKPDELRAAMRHGSTNPGDTRSATDLGRFGLGLKTASLSQCRQLTVVTLRRGQLSAARWDLDVISRTQKWTLLLLDPKDIQTLPFIDALMAQETGTVVLWRSLDRLSAGEESIEAGLGEGMVRVREHLALVFHRFLEGDGKISMAINEDPIVGRDPFLTWHRATQILPEERIRIDGGVVAIQPYILPHYSKLAAKELELAGGEEGLRRQQGFYVYRNRRLIIWGTWFRLARQEELTKLARVRVDTPNSLDHLWTLDIKKSTAHPPIQIRTGLRRIVERIAEGSRRVYTYRGRRTGEDGVVHVWDRFEERSTISYKINRDHPIVTSVAAKLDETDLALFGSLLKGVEEMFPAEALYADMASDRRQVHQRPIVSEEELADLAGRLLDACGTDAALRTNLLSHLTLLEPFSHFPELTRAIISRIQNER
jgi:hypothetical protein